MTDPNDRTELEALLGGAVRRPRWLRWSIWSVLALIVAGGAFLVARRLTAPVPIEYVTEQVRRGALAVTVTATGNLAPTNQIDVGSEISGIVARVLVDVNARVAKDQPLAVIDTKRLEDAVDRSRAGLAANEAAVNQARATVNEAEAQLERLREVHRLSNQRVPSQTELAAQAASVERALAALRSAEANVVSARAQLSTDLTQLSKAVIRSPVAGVVLKRSVDPGQTVQAAFNTPTLFIIAEDLAKMKLEVAVDEADIGQVREGMRASFTVDAYPGRVYPAKIERVNLGARNLASANAATAATSNVVSYAAKLSFANTDLSLRPGMTATATIETVGAKDALLVPNVALRFNPPEGSLPTKKSGITIRPPQSRQTQAAQERGIGVGSRQTVYVIEASGAITPIAVVTGPSDGRHTAVSAEGLQPGMAIVTGRKANGRDG